MTEPFRPTPRPGSCERRAGAERFNLVVVDNASTDYSSVDLSMGRAQFKLIENAHNLGFAKAILEALRKGARRICDSLPQMSGWRR